MSPIEIVSFGYLHGQAPDAAITLDVRAHFRDPHIDPAMRERTGLDAAVQHTVLHTPGIPALLDAAVAAVGAYLSGPTTAPVTVAVGCAGGRHRSVVLAQELASRCARAYFTGATLTHRDVHRPVVQRPTSPEPEPAKGA